MMAGAGTCPKPALPLFALMTQADRRADRRRRLMLAVLAVLLAAGRSPQAPRVAGRRREARAHPRRRRRRRAPTTIRAAHRRLLAAVHPDRGGSADLTRRVNAARDLLLQRDLSCHANFSSARGLGERQSAGSMTHRFDPTSLREYDIRGIVGKTLGDRRRRRDRPRLRARCVRRAGGTRVAVGYDGRHLARRCSKPRWSTG